MPPSPLSLHLLFLWQPPCPSLSVASTSSNSFLLYSATHIFFLSLNWTLLHCDRRTMKTKSVEKPIIAFLARVENDHCQVDGNLNNLGRNGVHLWTVVLNEMAALKEPFFLLCRRLAISELKNGLNQQTRLSWLLVHNYFQLMV